MKNKFKSKGGFTLIEMLVVMAAFGFILAITVLSYNNIRNNIVLNNNGFEIANALREAQSRSIVSKNNQVHGVHFNSADYILYDGHWPDITSQTAYSFSQGINIYSGEGISVEFMRLTGGAVQAEEIVIGTTSGNQKTIRIAASGRISIE
ncbi:MAG: type II secretion system protein [bacterium]